MKARLNTRRQPFSAPLSIANRRGFTLIELMIVITVMALVAGITVPAALKLVAGDRVTEGARTLQAIIASAKDRAAGAGQIRGIRLVTDTAVPSYARSVIFVRPSDPISLGTAQIVQDPSRSNVFGRVEFTATADDPDSTTTQTQIRNLLLSLPFVDTNLNGIVDASDYYTGTIRLEKSGNFFTFKGYPAGISSSTPYVTLDTPVAEPDNSLSATTSPARLLTYEIPRGAVPLEDAEPVVLPGGVVIDLGQMPTVAGAVADMAENRLSRITRDETIKQFDIMFSPNGSVVGTAARETQIVLWVRDEQDGAIGQNPNFSSRREVISGATATQSLVVLYSRSGFASIVNPFYQERATPDGFFDFTHYYDNIAAGFGSGI